MRVARIFAVIMQAVCRRYHSSGFVPCELNGSPDPCVDRGRSCIGGVPVLSRVSSNDTGIPCAVIVSFPG